jgi:hypothetical protein
MAKKLFVTLVLTVAFAVPSVSQAAIYDDFVRQIESLLQQVASLQQQLNWYQGGSVAVVTDFESCTAAGNAVMESYHRQCRSADGRLFVENVTATPPIYTSGVSCPALSRTLVRGVSGTDVRALQEFLQSTGDYTFPAITGYFGPATEQALQRWQARNSVVSSGAPYTTGFGVVGPRTRAAIQQYCGGTMPPVIPPDSGEAPSNCKIWYDGCNTCSRTYPGGPLMCTLRACIWQAPSYCQEYFDGGSTANQPPVINSFSGPTVLSVNQSGTWTIRASDPENGQLTYYIDWGDAPLYAASADSLSVQRSFVQTTTFEHSYARTGSYTVDITVRDNTGRTTQTTSTVTVRAASASGSQFNVSPTSGSAPLRVTATIVVPPGPIDTYEVCGPIVIGTIYWGDGTSERPTRLGCSSQTTVYASHTYENTGTYQATFTDMNGTRIASRTIEVGRGGTVCTMEYAPVCGVFRPGEGICVDGTNYGYCSGETKTFGNMCLLNSDTLGFEFLHYGECGS